MSVYSTIGPLLLLCVFFVVFYLLLLFFLVFVLFVCFVCVWRGGGQKQKQFIVRKVLTFEI